MSAAAKLLLASIALLAVAAPLMDQASSAVALLGLALGIAGAAGVACSAIALNLP